MPIATKALDLLARAEGELIAATFSQDPADCFRHAHLAALRAGAAVLAVRGRPTGRRVPRSVWDLVALVAPELAEQGAFFAAGAPLRQAVEAGLTRQVDEQRADAAFLAAEDFVAHVRALAAPGADSRAS